MNYRLVLRTLGSLIMIEALCMLPALLISLAYQDGDAVALLCAMAITALCGLPLHLFIRTREKNLRAREGFVIVALAWLALSAFGALPFLFGGMFTNFVDAFFETVSGFTTTGATVLTVFEGQPRGLMFWRSFTHWIGGMGVLVLALAIMPQVSQGASHLMRAESPGPELCKIQPKTSNTAKILYLIYGILTAVEFLALIIAGMTPYDAAIHAMSTAGTGGFSNYALSVGAFNSAAIDAIITVFMVLFGVNFSLYYRALTGDLRSALKSEELRWYLGIFAAASLLVSLFILPSCGGSFFSALRYGSFQSATIMSTTGFTTADFNLWPQAAKMVLLLLMLIGSCAGSTGGGIKVVRVVLLCKQGIRQVRRTFQPRTVETVRFEGRGTDKGMLSQISVFFFVYVFLFLVGAFLLSLNGLYDLETNLTAALTCLSNVGPGFGFVGPVGNFAGYNMFSKCVLSLLMLAGRLELFPILVLFHHGVWKRSN